MLKSKVKEQIISKEDLIKGISIFYGWHFNGGKWIVRRKNVYYNIIGDEIKIIPERTAKSILKMTGYFIEGKEIFGW